ncbi:hypothetical protein MicvaDRAFT_0311 [Microcoleus vaginatus FGP-2]|nr:hypothetical protein MicvaDRAFT_0311 [Microcoleus vaginatus FGP-2]
MAVLRYVRQKNLNKRTQVKYFFLSDGWKVGRVWGVGGEWSHAAWRRAPDIQQLNLCLSDRNEKMWLYRVEDAVLMVEVQPAVRPDPADPAKNIGNVTLTRLIDAEQVLERLGTIAARCEMGNPQLM